MTTPRTPIAPLCLVGWLTGLALVTGCREPASEAPRPCCDQPKIPQGVTPFKIVADEIEGPSDGQKVRLRAVLGQDAQRQEIYPVLHTLYRHAMTRSAFEPITFQADLYRDEAAANAGQGAIAQIERDRGQMAPTCENRVLYTFQQSAEIAFGEIFRRKAEEDLSDTCRLGESRDQRAIDEGFEKRAAIQVDPASRTIEITYPYTKMGQDVWASDLRYTSALKDWIDYTTRMFRRVPNLKALTFVGVHNDAEVLRIALTREQFGRGFFSLQEDIAAHAAVIFQKMGMKASNEQAAFKEQEAFYSKTFKTALDRLPKDQVKIAKTLK